LLTPEEMIMARFSHVVGGNQEMPSYFWLELSTAKTIILTI